MSARVKAKNMMGDQKDVTNLFNQMMSPDHVNVNIGWPKYLQFIELSDEFINIFLLLKKSTILNNDEKYHKHIKEIENFLSLAIVPVDKMKNASYMKVFSTHLGDLNETNPVLVKEFRDNYQEIKKISIVNVMQIICDKLMPYRADIEDIKKLDGVFIETMPGVEFCPFPFTTIDFKDLFLDDDIDEKGKKYLLLILNKVFTVSYKMYEKIASPDVDVDEFVDVILNNLEKLKKHAPQLSRCHKAFSKIKQSAQLLRTKFTTYYRDLQETQSPTIMMENFILDVANETDADMETMRQFKKIIKYYREMSAKSGNVNPQIKMLFDKVDEHFKQYDNAVKEEMGPDVNLEPSSDEEENNETENKTTTKSSTTSVELTEEQKAEKALADAKEQARLDKLVQEIEEIDNKNAKAKVKSKSKGKDK